MRILSLLPFLPAVLAGCDFSVKVTNNDDTGGPPADDSGDTLDDTGVTGTNVPMRHLIHVEFDAMGTAGYSSIPSGNGMVFAGAPGEGMAFGWEVDVTDAYAEYNVPPDAADFTYTGDGSSLSAIGGIHVPATGMGEDYTCFGADYDSSFASNGGKLSCFADSKIVAGLAIDDTDADLIVYGATDDLYLGEEALSGDVDGDGIDDLVVGGGIDGTIYVLSAIWDELGSATTLPLEKTVPLDEDLSFVACDVDGDGVSDTDMGYCKAMAIGPDRLLVTDAYNMVYGAGVLEIWALPLNPLALVPELSATTSASGVPVGNNAVWTQFGWLVNYPIDGTFVLIEEDLLKSVLISMPPLTETWGIDTTTIDGDPWIALGTTGYDVDDESVGAVFVANLADGPITDYTEARFLGTGTGNNRNCGWQVMFGSDVAGEPVVATSCYHPDHPGGRGFEVFALDPE